MAKRKDTPDITVILENGKLIPVSAYDQELLMKWRDGTVLNVAPSEAKPRPAEKKYFAGLNELIKLAETPWKNSDEAHEAIKARAGFVSPVKRADGTWGANSRHISSFTDAELDELWEYLCALALKRYSISLKDRPDPDPSPIPAKVEEPKTDSPKELTSPSEGLSVRGSTYTQLELDWMKQSARMLLAAVGPETDVMKNQALAVAENTPDEGIGEKAKEIVQKIYRHCAACCTGKAKLDKSWVAYVAGCREEDLRPEAR